MWEGVGDRTELQHIDPHSIGHNRVSFPFSWAAQRGPGGPPSLGAGFLYRILSPTHLIPNCNCSIGGLRAHSAGCWLSLSHLVSNSSDPQLVWSPNLSGPQTLNRGPEGSLCWLLAFSTASRLQLIEFPVHWVISYFNVHIYICGRHNRTHSTRPWSRLYSDIPWADAPVIYTGAFPILTARPGHRSIYNTLS